MKIDSNFLGILSKVDARSVIDESLEMVTFFEDYLSNIMGFSNDTYLFIGV